MGFQAHARSRGRKGMFLKFYADAHRHVAYSDMFILAKIMGRATDGCRMSNAITPASGRYGGFDIHVITSRSQRRR